MLRLEGKVIVSFVVNVEGMPSDFAIIKGMGANSVV